ncbi:MAG TPA: hypothetical protein PLP01_03900 [Phycisphaerae bacterium]|nr:hypothetical protein [Phycisphaerae bacterium]HOI54369.1 hypothetical protein [Phycisphaerae bacterium]
MKVSRILFLFAAMVTIGMVLVTLRAETQQAGYTVGRLQAEQRDLKRQCLELQMEIARLRNPLRLEDQVEQMALGLEPPDVGDAADMADDAVEMSGF